ncbi:MAG: TetR family transcriptional regulator [Henriciella sp.]|uniref:TetR/AcrR family transcriptional regulator n=1 Tax=uncultured Henriciella sp. TaxID=1608424 RepID=UPI000C418362|nr:TetR/AcrR family transcriptional regulator [Henriciella sp.]MAN74788.1 TetR family transcriptional regulator [Henriciella sp.]MBF32812.1 TetR family transcriptional regulator [Hyphomonadaceae bacterium]MBK75690.1 TetR family transcriptional regulator [Henriciella sp.]
MISDISDLDTKVRIKICARRLFAERGVEAVTVREIVAASGAKNGGSLNYYFKSKEGLIMELLADVFRDSSDGWLEALSDLQRTGGPRSVRDIVTILVRWPEDHSKQEDPSPTANRFLNSLLSTRRKMVRDFLEKGNFSVFAQLLRYIRELKPDLPQTVMEQRLIYFSWYIISARAAHESYVASGKKNPIWEGYDPLENLIDCGVGLIEAPCTVTEKQSAAVTRTKSSANKTQARSRALDAAFPSS